MQSFTVFDIVIVSITVLLGLKGLLRGFIKEVFGLVGIVGGIFVASRMTEEIGQYIAPVLGLQSSATTSLISFIVGLIGFWLVVYILGTILSKIFEASGLGLFDRIFGFIFGSAKIFLIFSVITYAIYQVQSFKVLMDKKVSDSITFPHLIETGKFIVKLDPSAFTQSSKAAPSEPATEVEDKTVPEKSFSQEVKETVSKMKEATVESGNAIVDTVKQSVQKNIDDASEKVKEEVQEAIQQTTKEEGN